MNNTAPASKVLASKSADCSRCGGSGFIKGYAHVEGGRCFKCNRPASAPAIASNPGPPKGLKLAYSAPKAAPGTSLPAIRWVNGCPLPEVFDVLDTPRAELLARIAADIADVAEEGQERNIRRHRCLLAIAVLARREKDGENVRARAGAALVARGVPSKGLVQVLAAYDGAVTAALELAAGTTAEEDEAAAEWAASCG
jgi:hypothetical protein